jgi:hypothetical protein
MISVAPMCRFQRVCPVDGQELGFADWWVSSRKQVQKDCRKGFNNFVVLIV